MLLGVENSWLHGGTGAVDAVTPINTAWTSTCAPDFMKWCLFPVYSVPVPMLQSVLMQLSWYTFHCRAGEKKRHYRNRFIVLSACPVQANASTSDNGRLQMYIIWPVIPTSLYLLVWQNVALASLLFISSPLRILQRQKPHLCQSSLKPAATTHSSGLISKPSDGLCREPA